MRAQGRNAEAQCPDLVRAARIRQLIVHTRQVGAAVTGPEYRAGNNGRRTAAKRARADVEPGRREAPGELTRRTGRHLAVPDMPVLGRPQFVEILRWGIDRGIGVHPCLVCQIGIRRRRGKIGMFLQHANLRVHGAGNRPCARAPAGHRVDAVGQRSHLECALQGVLERRDAGTEDILSGHGANTASVGRPQTESLDREKHTAAYTEHTQLEQVAARESGLHQLPLDLHGATDEFLVDVNSFPEVVGFLKWHIVSGVSVSVTPDNCSGTDYFAVTVTCVQAP